MGLFDFKFNSAEMKRIFDFKRWIIIGLAALAVKFVILAPFGFLWEGWQVVIAAIAGFIASEYLGR